MEVFDARAITLQKPIQGFPRPDFADNEELKKSYGIAIGQGLDAFNAGMQVFNDLPKALWASLNWAKDPAVIAAKDIYLKALKKAAKPLDKEELLEEVLQTSKICAEDKDRIAALKLYSEICGYTGPRLNIDASTTNNANTTNNTMQIVLVKGSEERVKTIDNIPEDTNSKSKISNNGLPNLKLVGGSR